MSLLLLLVPLIGAASQPASPASTRVAVPAPMPASVPVAFPAGGEVRVVPSPAPASAPAGATVGILVTDAAAQPIARARARLRDRSGTVVARALSGDDGAATFRGVAPGEYTLEVDANGYLTGTERVGVAPGTPTVAAAPLVLETPTGVVVVHVRVHRQPPPPRTGVVAQAVSHQAIESLPEGKSGSVNAVVSTQAGVASGAFGQVFVRGMHGEVQYQLDGVPLPATSGLTFSTLVDPRNLERMDLITGGYPAEYGLQLGAIVDLITRSGTVEPGGEAELRFGTYQTLNPALTYGGHVGWLRYYAGASYLGDERGIDPPQFAPIYHDHQRSGSQILTLDATPTEHDRLTLVESLSANNQEIPNFTNGGNAPDQYGNPPLPNVPPDTNDRQNERNAMAVLGWHHTFGASAFLLLSPYVRATQIDFLGDPANDLAAGPGSGATSTTEHRTAWNQGGHAVVSDRVASHDVKAGADFNLLLLRGTLTITQAGGPPASENDRLDGTTESAWAQDGWSLGHGLTLDYGLRFDAYQEHIDESAVSPRVALSWAPGARLTLHAYYGRLFMPPPAESLVATAGLPGVPPGTFNTRAEDDQDFEAGIDARLRDQTVRYSASAYYRPGRHVLDDIQLGTSALFVPYNYRTGLAYGLDQMLGGQLSEHWSAFATLSLGRAMGTGIESGLFLFPVGTDPNLTQRLDHDQLASASAGLSYQDATTLLSADGQFGSGFPTGPNNSETLPPHVTFNFALGRAFTGPSWWQRERVEVDVLNLLNVHYAYNIANGFNGNHFAPGRAVYLRLIKEL